MRAVLDYLISLPFIAFISLGCVFRDDDPCERQPF